jgi:hypothetical protein
MVTAPTSVTITGLSGRVVVHSELATLKAAWQAPLKDL